MDPVNVAALSEEDFDKQFEEMMSTPVNGDEDEAEVVAEATPDVEEDEEEIEVETSTDTSVETEDDENEDEDEVPVEQQQAEADEEEEDTNPEKEVDETEPAKDGASTTDEPKKYNLNELPMDEVLPFEVKASGSKMKVTLKELIQGFEKGVDYTQKLQGVAGLRKTGALMSENGLTEDDLNLLIEAKGGNKQALAKILGDSGVDSDELEPEDAKDYIPNNYAKEPISFELESVREEINRDTEYLPQVQGALNTMPQEFFDEIAPNANNLKALYSDVKSGKYQDIMPEMQKMSTLQGRSPSVELYREAANIVADRTVQAKPEIITPVVPQVDPVKEAARQGRRSSAVSATKQKAPAKATKVNFNDLDDSDFEAEFKKMTGRAISDYK